MSKRDSVYSPGWGENLLVLGSIEVIISGKLLPNFILARPAKASMLLKEGAPRVIRRLMAPDCQDWAGGSIIL
jgi:hypothetical protein